MTLARRDDTDLTLVPTAAEVVAIQTEWSKELMAVVEKQHLFATIQGKKYLNVEAWEMIGHFDQTFASTLLVEAVHDHQNNIIAYAASVRLLKHGVEVGGAQMSCGLDEFVCQGKQGWAQHVAAQSMAQTRATSKAYRLKYAGVARMGGYEPTPADEMTGSMAPPSPQATQGPPPDVDPVDACPDHGKPWRESSRGKYCATKLQDGSWCKQKPPAAAREGANAVSKPAPAPTAPANHSKALLEAFDIPPATVWKIFKEHDGRKMGVCTNLEADKRVLSEWLRKQEQERNVAAAEDDVLVIGDDPDPDPEQALPAGQDDLPF